MLDCLILGDSIAVGTKMFRPECADYAKGGITSHGWFKKYGNNDLSAKTVIISLSTNDYEKADTESKLRQIRSKVNADKVFWVEPNIESKPDAVKHVHNIAKEFNDVVIQTTRWQKDKIHPSWAGYKNIAEKSKN
jgi:lysophospholipase L1-like esterase